MNKSKNRPNSFGTCYVDPETRELKGWAWVRHYVDGRFKGYIVRIEPPLKPEEGDRLKNLGADVLRLEQNGVSQIAVPESVANKFVINLQVIERKQEIALGQGVLLAAYAEEPVDTPQ